jgi:hypothetical protein
VNPGASGEAPPATSAPTSPPAPTSSPAEPELPPTVGAAVAALAAEVAQGRDSGDISRRAANEIARSATAAGREYQAGNVGEAIAQLEELHGRIDQLEDDDQIASEDQEQDLEAAIADVIAAMEAA